MPRRKRFSPRLRRRLAIRAQLAPGRRCLMDDSRVDDHGVYRAAKMEKIAMLAKILQVPAREIWPWADGRGGRDIFRIYPALDCDAVRLARKIIRLSTETPNEPLPTDGER